MSTTPELYKSTLTPQQIDEAFKNIANLENGVQSAENSATLAESWAVGGTGTREGEDLDNAKYWATQAQTIAQGALGWFATPQDLQTVHPTGQNGQWAIIGQTGTIWIWDEGTSAWINTATRINLSNYYTKSQTDSIVQPMQSNISGLQSGQTSLESRVKNLNFMKPGDPSTSDFLNAMGTGGAAATATWEQATDGNNYLVFTVQGTRVFAIRGFCGFNII